MLLLSLVVACGRGEAPAPSTEPGASPARVISLTPSATEIVAALGAADQLVGVDAYSTYPPEVTKLPKVGSFLTPNLEVIVSLRPSVVIVDDIHGGAAGALRDAGVRSVECAMHALPDVKKAIRTLGAELGKTAEAERVIDEIDGALDAAAASRPAKRPRVLAIIDREAGGLGNLVAAGPGSWLDELLALAGGENVLAASGVRYPKISMEEILRGQPDVILDLSSAARHEITAWQAADVPAVKAGRVRAHTEPYLTAPSPRVKEALETLRAAIATP